MRTPPSWPNYFWKTSLSKHHHWGLGFQDTNFAIVWSQNHDQLFATPWTAAHQASLSFTVFQSLLKLVSIELVMPSHHLILCRPLLLLSSIFPSIRDFSNESPLHQVVKVLELQLQQQTFQSILRVDFDQFNNIIVASVGWMFTVYQALC